MKKASILIALCTAWMLTQGASVAYAGTSGSGTMASGSSSMGNSMGNTTGGMGSGSSMPAMNNQPGLMSADVTMESTGGSTASGTVKLSVTQSGLQVTLQMSGLTAGESYTPEIRYGEVGADAGSGWTLPTVTADSNGTVSLTTNVSGIVAIPEDGWYFRLDTLPSVQGAAGTTVAQGNIGQALSSDTTVATETTSSYLISLQIGPTGSMITPAQAAAGQTGDIMPMTGTSMPGMNTTFNGMPVNHHLEVHVFNLKTGAIENNIMPTISITDPATGKTSNVSAVAMYGSDVGMPDYHYGNNVYLATGSYEVTVSIGSETAQFQDVSVQSPASIIYVSPTGSDTSGQGTQASPYQTIDHALSVTPPNGTVIVEPGTYKEMVTITQPVTLESDPTVPNAAANTIIDATGQNHAVRIQSSDVTVQGLTLENAQQEGLLAAGKGALTDLTICDNVITNNALGKIPQGVDYEALHLVGVQDSFVLDNQSVKNKDGGLQLSDETAPSFGDVISGNTVDNNAIDCGITIVSHVAHHGTYDNTISNNWSEGNGAGGIMLATPVPGGIVSNNMVMNNHVEDNGLGGIDIHTHAPGSTVTGNAIVHNWVVFNKPDFGVTTVPTGIDVGAGGSPITNTTIANNLVGYETDGINIQDSAGVNLSGNWTNPNVKHGVTHTPMPKLSVRPKG